MKKLLNVLIWLFSALSIPKATTIADLKPTDFKFIALGTNIIGGERRDAEAVIPLNDETMERLGSAIAKHMNINLTNVNQMNGRTISRELKTIMNENEFTYNG